MKMSADGLRAYVAGATDVAMVDMATMAVTHWPASATPGSLALSSDGSLLYVGDRTATGVVVINTTTGAVAGVFPLSHRALRLKVSANGEWLVAADQSTLSAVRLSDGDTSSHTFSPA